MKRPRIRPRIGGAVYVLPNLLTTGNLFFGYHSIIKSMHGQFGTAAVAILLASIFDILDGRVARLTKGTSEFGVQYDSLCDLVSFGLAPALLMYQYSLHQFGRPGWIVCFIFLACGALRLARFNVQSSIGKIKSDFIGLPIPMAACLIACFIAFIEDVEGNVSLDTWLMQEVHIFLGSQDIRSYLLLILAPLLGVLMVSDIAYRSHKSINIRIIKPFKLLAILVTSIGLLAYRPAMIGFVFFLLYSLSGIVEWIMGWKVPGNEDDIFEPPPHMIDHDKDYNEE